jgi:hypothetical protein
MVRLSWFWFSHVAIFSNLDQLIKTIAFSGKNKIVSAPAISAIYLKDKIFFLHIYSKFKADNCLWRKNVSWWFKWWVNWSRRRCQLNWISDIMMCDYDVCRKIRLRIRFKHLTMMNDIGTDAGNIFLWAVILFVTWQLGQLTNNLGLNNPLILKSVIESDI